LAETPEMAFLGVNCDRNRKLITSADFYLNPATPLVRENRLQGPISTNHPFPRIIPKIPEQPHSAFFGFIALQFGHHPVDTDLTAEIQIPPAPVALFSIRRKIGHHHDSRTDS
jgi:hypothetical protein